MAQNAWIHISLCLIHPTVLLSLCFQLFGRFASCYSFDQEAVLRGFALPLLPRVRWQFCHLLHNAALVHLSAGQSARPCSAPIGRPKADGLFFIKGRLF